MCSSTSVSPLMCSLLMCSGCFPAFCPLHTVVHFSHAAPWKGLCAGACACVRVRTCACWIWRIREEGHQIHRVAFLPGPLVLLGAATKTDRKEIEKSYNSNCHPEKASQTRPWSDRGRTLPFLLQLFSLQQSGLSSISMEITHPTPHHQHNGGFVIDLKRKRCIGRRKYIYNS